MDLQCTQIIEQDHLNEPSLTQTEAKTQIQVGTLEIGDVKYPILSGITKIGRHPAHQIFLEDIMVSKFHAEIEANGKSVFISDLKSSNKTRLDDAVLTPWRFYMVQDGASLKFGNVEARFFLKRPEDERIPVPATPEPGLSPGLDESQEDSVIEATARSQDDARFRRPAVPNRRKIPMMNPLTPGDDPLETQVNSGDDIQNLETQQSTQQHDRTSDSDLHDMDASRSANSSQSAKDDRRNIQEVNTQCLAVGDDAEGDGLPGPSKSPSRGNHKKSSDHPEPSRSLPQHPSNIQTLETQASTSEGPSKDHSNHSSMIHDFQTQKVNLDDHIQSLKTQKTEEPGKSRGKSLSPHERDVQSLNADIWGADDDNLQDIHDLQTQSNLEFLENSRRRKEDVFRSQSSSPDLVADSEQMIIDFAHHGSIFDDSKSHENRRRKMAMGGGNQRVVDVPENFPAINDKSSKSDGKSAGDDDDVETDFEDDLLTLGNHSDVSKNNSQKSQSSGNDFTSLVSEVERILEDSGDETDFNDLDKSVKVIKSSKSDLKNSKSSTNNSTSLKSVLNHSDEETDFEEEVTVSKMSDSLKVIPASSDDDTDFEADPLPSKSFRKKSPDKRKLSSESPKSPKSVGQANRTISVSSDSSKCGNDRRESSKSSKSSQKSSKSPPENDPKSSKVINGHSSSEIIRETSPKSSGVIRISSDSDTDYEDPSKIPNKSKSSRNDVDDSNLPPEVLKMLKKAETSRDIYADDDDDYDPYSAPTQVIVQSKSLRRPQKNITSNLESCSGPSKTPGNHHDFDHTTEDSMPTQKIDRKFTTKNAAFDFDDLEPTQKMNHPGISGRKTPRMLDFDDDLEPTQISSRSAPGPSNARPDDFDDLGPTQILNFDKTQSQPLPDDPSSRKWPFEDEENSKKRMALLNDSDPTQIIDVQAIKRQNNRQKNHKSFGDSGVNMNVKLRSQQISSSDSPELKGHAETISSSSRVTKRQRTTRNPQTLENPLKKTNSTPKKNENGSREIDTFVIGLREFGRT
uniref:FHA domain-containing protein n=1 Tax=Fopius arisanus TaxID=64838 RepID=A0A0C9PW96_9HYME